MRDAWLQSLISRSTQCFNDVPSSFRLNPRQEMLSRLEQYFPDIAAALAYRMFCTPRISAHRSADHSRLISRARFHLRHARHLAVPTRGGQVQAYVFEPESPPAATVLLVHGWTSEASFMSAFARYFRGRGFRVVMFDFPAHGQSAGRRTNIIDCAHAIREVAELLGPVHYVVSHSLGGLASLLACWGGKPMTHAYPFEGFVFVSLPNSFHALVRQFSSSRSLSPEAQRQFEKMLELEGHRRLDDFTGANLLPATSRPALLLHCADDREIPLENAQQVAIASPTAQLKTFQGLGHRKILYAPAVIREASQFIETLCCAPSTICERPTAIGLHPTNTRVNEMDSTLFRRC